VGDEAGEVVVGVYDGLAGVGGGGVRPVAAVEAGLDRAGLSQREAGSFQG
jgi:hypothetical protein